MNNEKLIINGSGSSKGGKFQIVEINGSGIVSGDIECESLRFNGSGKADGKVKAEDVIISGSGKITGAVEQILFILTDRHLFMEIFKRIK